MFIKWLSRRKRCILNEKPRKLIKELYSSCENVDSWRGNTRYKTKITPLDNRAKMALLDSSFAADFKARTIQNDFPSPYFNLLWVYTSEGTKFCPTRNFKVDRGKSMNTHANIFIFNRFCKAFASLVVICLMKFLQESVDHPCNVQPSAARSIWRFRTW